MAKLKVCKHCGKEFEPTRLMQSLCSPKCAMGRMVANRLAKKTKLKSYIKDDTLRKDNDRLYQKVCKKIYPHSIISGEPTEVIHHFVYKSQSNSLRYYIPNGVPLTNKEHRRLHDAGDSTMQATIVSKRGLAWWEDLKEKKNIITKLNVPYLEETNQTLKGMLNSD